MTFLLKIFVCNKIKVFLFSTSRLVKLVNVYIHYPSICLTPSFLDAFKGKQTNFWFWVDSFHWSHTLWEYISLLFKLLTLWVPALGEPFFRVIFRVPPEESTFLTKIQTQFGNTFTVMQFCISDKIIVQIYLGNFYTPVENVWSKFFLLITMKLPILYKLYRSLSFIIYRWAPPLISASRTLNHTFRHASKFSGSLYIILVYMTGENEF